MLHRSSLPLVCDCLCEWLNGSQKNCKSLCIKVLHECSHLPFMLVRWPAGESGSLKDVVLKKCLIQCLIRAFWEGFPQDFKVCL